MLYFKSFHVRSSQHRDKNDGWQHFLALLSSAGGHRWLPGDPGPCPPRCRGRVQQLPRQRPRPAAAPGGERERAREGEREGRPPVLWERCRDTRPCCVVGTARDPGPACGCPAGPSGSRIPRLSGQALGRFGKAWSRRLRAAPGPGREPGPAGWSWRCGSGCSPPRAPEVSGRHRHRLRKK